VVSKNINGCSSSVPIIVVEHAAETFPSADRAFDRTDLVSGFDDLPAAPLMVPLFVIVDEIFVHDMPKVVLSKEHQPVTSGSADEWTGAAINTRGPATD
jgi:hypothetical protein